MLRQKVGLVEEFLAFECDFRVPILSHCAWLDPCVYLMLIWVKFLFLGFLLSHSESPIYIGIDVCFFLFSVSLKDWLFLIFNSQVFLINTLLFNSYGGSFKVLFLVLGEDLGRYDFRNGHCEQSLIDCFEKYDPVISVRSICDFPLLRARIVFVPPSDSSSYLIQSKRSFSLFLMDYSSSR